MLKIWGRRTSSNVQALMWAVGELGLDYERTDIGHKYGGNRTPEFLAMNPNGLVPVLKDGADGEPLFESAAIIRYLSSRYGAAPFWPEDPVARAHVDKWAEWAKATVAPAFTMPIFWLAVRTPEAERDPAKLEAAVANFARLLDIAEAELAAHPFLAGDDLTVADIMFGHLLYRYFSADEIARPSHPAVEAYYSRLTERPAYREHVMVSYEELRA
ncbi:glutathione S-transferase family protein [Martelella sp. HB161492]|uniref:glutathione S-transferase family protein n=1 Tax=Martelella sp. HB161492 TaxID=2720726 RepID=UPI001592714D|nr:glutathione S-transferase family protein [Martelella sp. HB161492]